MSEPRTPSSSSESPTPGSEGAAAPTKTPFVARERDVEALLEHVEALDREGGRTVVLTAPLGGGRRALVGEVMRRLQSSDEDYVLWRMPVLEEEDGTRTLVRLYATLYAALARTPMLRGKAEMILGSQMPRHGARVQGWFKAFIDGLKRSAPMAPDQKVQLSLPRDNPLIGLVEVVRALAAKMPVILELQGAHQSHSVATWALVEALAAIAPSVRLLLLLSIDPLDDAGRLAAPEPMLDLLERRGEDFHRMELAPWSEEDTARYLDTRGLEADAGELARIGRGLPAYVAEVVESLKERDALGAPLAGRTLSDLVPRELDTDELDLEAAGQETDGGRRRVGPDDLDEVTYRAALLGVAFPSGLLADIAGYDRDSVDDLLDAAGDLFAELQFSKPLNTWIYRFTRGIWREAVLRAWQEDPERAERARTIGLETARFLERTLVPRGYDFVVKTLRLYATFGEVPRATFLKNLALAGDRPEVWAMTHDLLNHFEDTGWSDRLRRAVFVNLMERLAQAGDVKAGDQVFDQAVAWAQEHEDRVMQARVLLAGSRLDLRRQDAYRARDRARDARAIFEALDDKLGLAEIENHLALVELTDGNPAAALEHVDRALQAGSVVDEKTGERRVLPQVAAQSEFLRGSVRRREKKLDEAIRHFRNANEIAGRTQQAPLALEAGLGYGEALLAAGRFDKAADVLERVFGIAGALGNPARQRAAASLAAQAHGALKNNEAARTWAERTLALTEALKLEHLEPVDRYNVGFFHLLEGNVNEALALFRRARDKASLQRDPVFTKELLYNLAVAARKVGEKAEAARAFEQAIPAAETARDLRKVMGAHEALGQLALERGDRDEALGHLEAALETAEKANLKEERRRLRKALEAARRQRA